MDKTLFLLLLPIVALLLHGCDNDDQITDLKVSENYVFLKTSDNNWDTNLQHISISRGNGGYEISSDEIGKELADAQIVENVITFKTKGKHGTAKFLL